jgi:hypothetical protein
MRRPVIALILAACPLLLPLRPAQAQVCATATVTVNGSPTTKGQCQPLLDQFQTQCPTHQEGVLIVSVLVEVCAPQVVLAAPAQLQ